MGKSGILRVGLLLGLGVGLFNYSLVLADIPVTVSGTHHVTSADSPLSLGNDFTATVVSGGTLIIDSGVVVHFGSNSRITVASGGSLIISEGAVLDFDYRSGITVASGASMTCGSNSGAQEQLLRTGTGWEGISNEGGIIAIYHTLISEASSGVYQNAGQMVVDNSTFNQCAIAAIDAVGGVCRITNNIFSNNGSAVLLRDVSSNLTTTSLIAGNSFSNNEESLVMNSSNNVNICFNNFAENSYQTAIRLGDTFLGNHVSISYNNFIHASQEDGFYIIENLSSSLVSVYNSYWQNNGTYYTSATDLKTDLLITDSYVLAAPAFLTSPINYSASDLTAPVLVEVSPSRSREGTVTLTVVLSDSGWGVDPATVQISLVDQEHPSTILAATISNHYLSDRGHIFQATVNIPFIRYEYYYFWSITAADFAGNTLSDAGNERNLIITDQVDLFTTPAWSLGSYHLITIPLTTAESDHKLALDLTQPDTTLARYPNGTGPYLFYGESGFAEDLFGPGKGFWLYLGEGETYATRQVSGAPLTSAAQTVDFPNAGWYLIGNPFSPSGSNANLPFTYLSFTYDGSSAHNFTEAVVAGKVGFGMWDYSGGGYHFERTQLTAWKGYWIRIKEPCSLSFNDHVYSGVSLLSWDLQLMAAQNGSSDGANYLGLVRTAAAGPDLFDGEKPPALNTGLKSFFRPQGTTREFGTDFRSASSTEETWHYVLTGLTPGEAVISWNGLSAVPANYHLVLKDLVTATETNLRQNSSYRFTVGAEVQREFEVIMTDLRGQAITISGVDLDRNPFAPRRGESVTVTFNLDSPATVEVRIYDWVGNLVTVFPNLTGGIGSNSFTWNGRNNRGTIVANGVYFAKLLVRNGSETSSQIIKLVVRN